MINFFKIKDKTISYEDLKKLPNNGQIFVIDGNDNITAERLHTDPQNSVSLRVEIKNKASFLPHIHDCRETVIVRQGAFEEIESGIIRKKGEYMLVPAHKRHTIKALEDETIIYIEYKNPA